MAEEKSNAPSFGDIGSEAGELFGGFDVGVVQCTGSRGIKSGIDNKTTASVSINGKEPSNLQTEITLADLGLTLVGKVNDISKDRSYGFEATIEDQLAPGLKLGLEANYVPQGGSNAVLKGEFQQEFVHANLDIDSQGPALKSAVVLGMAGIFAGCELGFDIGGKELTDKNFAVGYACPITNIIAHAGISNLKDVSVSAFREFADQGFSAGLQVGFDMEERTPRVALAAQMAASDEITFKGYANLDRELGLALKHKLKGGHGSISLSTVIDTKHNIGCGAGISCGLAVEVEM